jgi:hypothetical protein
MEERRAGNTQETFDVQSGRRCLDLARNLQRSICGQFHDIIQQSTKPPLMSNPFSNNGGSGDVPWLFRLVTPQMVRARTVELAIGAGRSAVEIRQSDYEQAKRELTGETDSDRQHAVIHRADDPAKSGDTPHGTPASSDPSSYCSDGRMCRSAKTNHIS